MGEKCKHCEQPIIRSLTGNKWVHESGDKCGLFNDKEAMPKAEFEQCNKVHRTDVAYYLSEQEGKAVQEILRRYVGEELRPRVAYGAPAEGDYEILKDIDYIGGLADLFGE